MGLSQSAQLFERFSTFLHWLVANKANDGNLDHMLDDFIFAGKASSLDTFEFLCLELGVPLADEKSINPTTVMIFSSLEKSVPCRGNFLLI